MDTNAKHTPGPYKDLLTDVIGKAEEVINFANMMLDDVRAGLPTIAKADMLRDMEMDAFKLYRLAQRARASATQGVRRL